MKKLILLITCAFLFAGASGVQATPIEIGDMVKFTDHGGRVGNIGTGGVFRFQEKDNTYDWLSFCVELAEHIGRREYEVTGLSQSTTTGTDLAEQTAWLFWNFATENTDFGFNSSNAKHETDLQYLIWDFQGEDFGSKTYSGSSQLAIWQDAANAAVAGGWTNDYVQIVNLGSAQDQLVISDPEGEEQPEVPVPEPASIVLFGIGLLGLAGIRRKRILN